MPSKKRPHIHAATPTPPPRPDLTRSLGIANSGGIPRATRLVELRMELASGATQTNPGPLKLGPNFVGNTRHKR